MSARAQTSALLWFGLLGAPAAWAVQHVAGVELSLASCREAAAGPGWNLDLDVWTVVVSAVALAVALAAGAAALVTYRRTRDAGDEPPASRIHFLATIAVAITPLFVCIMLMSGIGELLTAGCRQS